MPTLSTLPTASVPFDQLNPLAGQLRQAGAKFSASISPGKATLKFRFLPTAAVLVLQNVAIEPTNNIDTHKTASFASLEQLSGLTKTRLKQLASHQKLTGRSKMNRDQLAQALVGKVPVSAL